MKLQQLAASAEGRNLIVSTEPDAGSVELQDVLVGEVWVCSGQSNMAWTLKASIGGDEAIAAAGDHQLRLFNAGARAVDEPQDTIGGQLAVDAPASATSFSGVAYYFGKELRKALGVPVGLIKSAVGGTVAEAWTPKQELETNPTLKVLLDQQEQRVAAYPAQLDAWKATEAESIAKWEAAVATTEPSGEQQPTLRTLQRLDRPVRAVRDARCDLVSR